MGLAMSVRREETLMCKEVLCDRLGVATEHPVEGETVHCTTCDLDMLQLTVGISRERQGAEKARIVS